MFPPPHPRERLRRGGAAAALMLFSLLVYAAHAVAHGGVVAEEDQCVLNIGFLKAHFTGYQPEARGAEEFCEDIPEVGESVFVIDYLHDFMKEMPVDFRIINDVEHLGQYAKWEDVSRLGDLDPYTIFYLPPARRGDGVLTASYRFEKAGGYIGIVTARHPTEDKVYDAVFFFQVGGRSYGYLPLFAGLILLAQLGYLASTGSLQRFVRRRIYPRSKQPRSAPPGLGEK